MSNTQDETGHPRGDERARQLASHLLELIDCAPPVDEDDQPIAKRDYLELALKVAEHGDGQYKTSTIDLDGDTAPTKVPAGPVHIESETYTNSNGQFRSAPTTWKTTGWVKEAHELMSELGLMQEEAIKLTIDAAKDQARVYAKGDLSKALARASSEEAEVGAAAEARERSRDGVDGEKTGSGNEARNRNENPRQESPNDFDRPIGEGNTRRRNGLQQGADAAENDSGDGNLGRLENDQGPDDDYEGVVVGSDLEELERQFDGNLSRLDSEADGNLGGLDSDADSNEADYNGYFQTEMRANYLQRDHLNEKVSKVPDQIQTVYRHGIIHFINCARVYWLDKWHAIHSEAIKTGLPGGWALDEIAGKTSRLWDFQGSVIQCYRNGEYVKPKDGKRGRCRMYRIDPAFAIEFWELAEKADANYKLHSEDGEPGKRDRSSLVLTTTLRDEGGNRWGEKRELPGGHYSLPDGAMRVMSDTEHKIDISEITEMKAILKQEYLEARARFKQTEKTYKNYAYFDEEGEARTEQEVEAIREARTKMQAMKTRKQKAEGRYHSLLSGLEVITRQADRVENGIAYLQNAYEIQPVSGRKTFKKGGPQGLPAVLKAFAYSMENVYNYDIKSSQTTGLRQLAEDLRRVGYDVDTEALDTYIERGGKDWVIDNYDLPRSLVKRVEHAIKFGGSIPASMEAAYQLKLNDDNSFDMPEVAEHVEEYYSSRDEQNRVLEDLNEVFGPQVQMIEDLAEGLITAYWDAHSRAGGRGKGRFMRNHCGITFCKYDHKEPVHDDDGNFSHYKYGHEAHSQAMAWYLQGLEAAYIDAITILSTEYDYEVMANEHDGVITLGRVPEETKERAEEISGARRSELVSKRFEDEEDVRELCNEHGFDYPSPPLEETPTDQCNEPQTRRGVSERPPRPAEGDGSTSTTSRRASSRPPVRKNTSNGATPAGGGRNGTTRRSGAGRASLAPKHPDDKQIYEDYLRSKCDPR